jgi:hypothetical protein
MVLFRGKLPKLTDMLEMLAASDALAHPALHEAFGNACVDGGGPALQVTNETGFRASSRSSRLPIQEPANTMQRHDDAPDLRLRQVCRERVRRDLSWEQFGKEMNEWYLVIASEGRHA